MEIRKNIFISAMIHATVIVSIFVAGNRFRGTAFRVPEDFITVSIFNEANSMPLSAQNTKHAGKASAPVLMAEPRKKERTETVNKEKTIIASAQNNNEKPNINDAATKADLSVQVIDGEVARDSVQPSAKHGVGQLAGDYSGKSQDGYKSSGHDKGLTGGGGTVSTNDMIRAAIEKAKIYPLLARKRKLEGTVTTEFMINSKGYPEKVIIVKSSGHEILDFAVLDIIKKAAPFPKVEGHILIPITFSLAGN